MQKILLRFLILLFVSTLVSFENTKAQNEVDKFVLMKTSMGDMKIKLYGKTPMHQENFIKLVNDKFYDGLLFHRVIKNFMIQSGDPRTRNVQADKGTKGSDPGYQIYPEFHPEFYHKKGALGAASNGNPEKKSSGSQFYIVQGSVNSLNQLKNMEQTGNHLKFTAEQKKTYMDIGGYPSLDYNYTVFGEVIEGFEVIDKIAAVETVTPNRPKKDVKIISITVIK